MRGQVWCTMNDSYLRSLPLRWAKVSVDMVGIGSMSCSHWRSTKEQLWREPSGSTVSVLDSTTLLRRVVNHRRKSICRR
jgi:hypothetical protein